MLCGSSYRFQALLSEPYHPIRIWEAHSPKSLGNVVPLFTYILPPSWVDAMPHPGWTASLKMVLRDSYVEPNPAHVPAACDPINSLGKMILREI